MSRAKKDREALAEDPTVTVEDCAALLGLSRNGAYNAVREGGVSIRSGARSASRPPRSQAVGLESQAQLGSHATPTAA
jgi:hypothetical protein